MTTLKQGGVLQRAVSFIENLPSAMGDFQWRLFLSQRVQNELDQRSIQVAQPVSLFEQSPARRTKLRKQISRAIDAAAPDLVFTFCGPSYLKLSAPELMGVADGWVTHSTREAYRSLSPWRNRLGLYLGSRYKRHWFRTAQSWIVQTGTAKRGLAERCQLPAERIHIVPNALAPWYRGDQPIELWQTGQKLRILYFAAPYSHKRHTWLPAICKVIEELGERNFEIVITIDPSSPIAQTVMAEARRLGVENRIVNLGSVPVADGLNVYRGAHICFVPSILETFSATYLEAMATRTPIVACDLDFARDTCGQAAVYFESANPRDAAKKILDTARDAEQCKRLGQLGREQLSHFPNGQQQMALYRDLIQETINQLTSSQSSP
ncbi:MAG: glycosyltransferase family 4 protein [Planctomycetota bacterium]|nr:glycosyltransferase family 4 protein [Planctomycetota bacterium]